MEPVWPCGRRKAFERASVRLMSERFLLTLRRGLNEELLQLSYNGQWTKPVGRPAVFQVELTNNCPMTCRMCPRTHAMTRGTGYMSQTVYRRVIDEASKSTSRLFLHHFGDSLLHPELGQCIRYAADRSIKTYLSANPVLLTRPRIEALVDNGLSELVLSLDGVTGETSSAVRGRAARNVELAEKRIQSLLDYRAERGSKNPYVILQIVRQRQNAHEIDDWLAKWEGRPGIDRLKVKSYITWNGREEKIKSLRPEGDPVRPPVVCDKPWTSVTVLWDGRVVPCCFDYDGLETLGDLGQQSLDEIWRGEPLVRLRDAHRRGALEDIPLCASCTDKDGYPVRKLFYPLNRLAGRQSPSGDEWR